MKLSKVRNSVRLPKVLIALILTAFSTLSVTAQYPVTYPQQYPGGYPIPTGTYPAGTYPTPQAPATQPGTPAGKRDVTKTDADDEAMTHEDSVRMAIEERETEDLELEKRRRKIFGYKLFNGVAYDPNLVINIPTPNNYVLGTNDRLIIDVYGYIQRHFEATVDADGYIRLEQAGVIKVGGNSIEEARQDIQNALSRAGFMSGNSRLKISLGDVRTIKVTITGEVIAPGSYTISSLSSVMTALYRSGGPNEVGSFREVRVVRNNQVVSTLDLYDILINGFSKDDILLKDQDVIVVPPFHNRLIVDGETKRTGYFELKKNETLQNGLDYAGGFSPDAYTQRIKVYRNNRREKEIYDVLYSDFQNFKMESGDSISVSKVLTRYTNMVNIDGAVYRPGQYSLQSSPTLTALVSNAEGLMDDALAGRVSLVRVNPDLTTTNISVNFADILSGKAPDIELKREDLILIPSRFDLNEESYVRIYGAINNPDAEDGVELPFVKNMTIEDVLIRVGGLTEAASLSRVEIVRRKRNVDITKANAQISELIRLDVNPNLEVVSGKENIVLEPYDEIFVRKSPNYEEQTFVEIQGEVFYPAVYGIESKEERISDIIKRAGGLTLQAYIPGATLIRTIELSQREIDQRQKTLEGLADNQDDGSIEVEAIDSTQEESIGIDLTSILKNPGSSEDLILRDGDVISIPKQLETVRVHGEVLYPTTVKFTQTSGFKSYISGAGGFTRQSMKRKSYVLYPNGSVDRTKKFLVFNIYPRIQPGSEIIVPQKPDNGTQQLEALARVLGTVSTLFTALFTIYGFINLNRNSNPQ